MVDRSISSWHWFVPCLHQEGGTSPTLVWGWSLIWSVEDGSLGEKKPSGYLLGAGPLVAADGLCVKGIRGEVS